MPTSNDTIPNRPLSGYELRQIIMKDIDDMLARDGMFTPHIAYGRVGYRVDIALQLDNPLYSEHKSSVESKDPSRNERDPIKKQLRKPPMKGPSDDAAYAGLQRNRVIDSPNHARIEHEIPVLIKVSDPQTGKLVDKEVVYDNSTLDKSPVEDRDTTAKVKGEWQL